MPLIGLLAILNGLVAQAPAHEAGETSLGDRAASLRAELLPLGAALPLDPVGSSLALAKLHLERAERILLGEMHDFDLTAESELDAAERALRWFREAQPPHPGVYGESLTLAYEATNDGSCQPYWVYVPSNYDPQRPWPLIVYLHGWVPETSKLIPWTVPGLVGDLCDEYGFIFMQPHGRGNTDFQGPGEGDVMRALEETMARYHVDPDRVHMTGNSMGGYGAACIGLHAPDRFASIAAACGQWDYYEWYGIDRDTVPASKRYLYSLSNPVDWLENALHLPVLLQHGERDSLVPPRQSAIGAARLADLGYEHTHHVVPNGYHQIYLEEPYFRRLMEFCLPLRRASEPAEVRFVTYSLDYDSAHWVRITGIEHWGERAEVTARGEPGRVAVSARNVSGLELSPPRSVVGEGPVAVEVNGEPLMWEGEAPLVWGEPVRPDAKRPQACGPIRAVFDGPFVCVYGAGSAGSESLCAGFTREWWSYAEGLPWVYEHTQPWPPGWAVADADVDEGLLAQRNLILFGRPEENQVLARIADQLPLGFIEGGYRVAGREFVGDDVGLWFCARNPFNTERMILSVSGYPWGAGFGSIARADHKFDLMPDFILFNSEIDADDGNRMLAGGVFGSGWEIQTLDLSTDTPGEQGMEAQP